MCFVLPLLIQSLILHGAKGHRHPARFSREIPLDVRIEVVVVVCIGHKPKKKTSSSALIDSLNKKKK